MSAPTKTPPLSAAMRERPPAPNRSGMPTQHTMATNDRIKLARFILAGRLRKPLDCIPRSRRVAVYRNDFASCIDEEIYIGIPLRVQG